MGNDIARSYLYDQTSKDINIMRMFTIIKVNESEQEKKMIRGTKIVLRPIKDEDWPIIEQWGTDRESLWGAYQRFQLDHIPLLHQVYQRTGLLSRESGLLLLETSQDQEIVGFVRYSLIPFPDADLPYPEIGGTFRSLSSS